MSDNLSEQLLPVRELALAAGALLLDSMGHVGTVAAKQATELVTELDGRVEEMLVAGIARHFPDDTVQAEEGGHREGGSGRTWWWTATRC